MWKNIKLFREKKNPPTLFRKISRYYGKYRIRDKHVIKAAKLILFIQYNVVTKS